MHYQLPLILLLFIQLPKDFCNLCWTENVAVWAHISFNNYSSYMDTLRTIFLRQASCQIDLRCLHPRQHEELRYWILVQPTACDQE